MTTWYGYRARTALDRRFSIASVRSTAREVRRARARSRMDACARFRFAAGSAFVQPTYRWRPQSVPALNRVARFSSAIRLARSCQPPRRICDRNDGCAAGDQCDLASRAVIVRRRCATRCAEATGPRSAARSMRSAARSENGSHREQRRDARASEDRGHCAGRQCALTDRRGIDDLRSVPAHARKPRARSSTWRCDGWSVCIVHGNGPQVGDELVRNEVARAEASPLPLGVLVAATAGWIGYMIQQSLENALTRSGESANVATIITQVAGRPRRPGAAEPDEIHRPRDSGERARRARSGRTCRESRRDAGSLGALSEARRRWASMRSTMIKPAGRARE